MFVSHSWSKSLEFYPELQVIALDVSNPLKHGSILHICKYLSFQLSLCQIGSGERSFILFLPNQYQCAYFSIHNYADNSHVNIQLPKPPSSLKTINNCRTLCTHLSNDFEIIMIWRARNIAQLTAYQSY